MSGRLRTDTKPSALFSPLRYPGAKRWISGYIDRAIDCNKLSVDLFVEPFAGGASVSISLLSKNKVKKIGINERDPLIASFWYVLFFDTDWLIECVQNTDVTLTQWEQLKKSRPTTIRQKAFKCFYLNRTSFSGILKSNAGPIGGKKQSSQYKIDCRFNKNTLIDRIRKISLFREKVAFVWNLDWENAIDAIIHFQDNGVLPLSTLFYLDPPFFKKGKALYPYYFRKNNHIELRDYLVKLTQSWILSYDMCSEIMSIYNQSCFSACDVNLIYTTKNYGRRELGKEIIVSNLPIMVSELQLGADKISGHPKILDDKFLTIDKCTFNIPFYDRINLKRSS